MVSFHLAIHIQVLLLFLVEGSKYIQNNDDAKAYRRQKAYNYDYEDWESKTPDLYIDTRKPAPTSDLTTISDVTSTPPTFNWDELGPKLDTTVDDSIFTSLVTPSTKDPLIKSIEEEKAKSGGMFTASVIVLLKAILLKESHEVSSLMAGVNWKIMQLNAKNELLNFGETFATFLGELAEMLSLAPGDVLQSMAKYTVYALENREFALRPDTNDIVDLANLVFNDRDIDKIAGLVRDVEKFPNASKTSKQIGSDFVEILTVKHIEIRGTAKEKMLFEIIDEALKTRWFIHSRRDLTIERYFTFPGDREIYLRPVKGLNTSKEFPPVTSRMTQRSKLAETSKMIQKRTQFGNKLNPLLLRVHMDIGDHAVLDERAAR